MHDDDRSADTLVEESTDAARRGLPPIESWWPYLSIPARHAVLRDPHAPLVAAIRDEIRRATGIRVPPGVALDEEDRQFIATQIEPVD